jgi:ubiquinone/menaquinone biosynthesis C-methylase UbiE
MLTDTAIGEIPENGPEDEARLFASFAAGRTDLGELSDTEVIDRFCADGVITLDGARIVDVGCGAGATSRDLAARGATVLGVEPDPIQAEKNRAAEPTPGLTFVESHANAVPVEPGSVDGVFFFRSLHHVPLDEMDSALRNAASVLKPGGFLWVVEPAMTGSHFPVMRPFNDETKVRTAAQRALTRTAAPLFDQADAYITMRHPRYKDFEAMVTRVTGQTFNQISREDVEQAHIRARFEETGRTADGDYVFDQPMLHNLYRGPKSA